MRVVKAPEKYITVDWTLFLAGSIEMGAAVDWQTHLTDRLADLKYATILNPRRDDWDSSWEQKIENDQFREQVQWELRGLARADCIAVYFDPETKSPITLMELGLWASSGKLIVCCPEGYWRKGNVDIVCREYMVRTATCLQDLETMIVLDYMAR